MRGRTQFTPALLLRCVDYRDADRIVTLLTPGRGRISAIARGARRSVKRFGSSLEPFVLIDAEVVEGRGQLDTLKQAQIVRVFPRILGGLDRMQTGGRALELVRALTPEGSPEASIYETTVELFEALDAKFCPCEVLEILFRVRLMVLAGFAPGLDACGQCGKRPGPSQAGLFDARAGELVCRGCGGARHELSADLRAHLANATGTDWLKRLDAPWSSDDLSSGRDVVRAFIEHRLERAVDT